MSDLSIDPTLSSDTRLFRYVSIERFMSLVETKHTVLTNVNEWSDGWEVILSKIPTVDEDGAHLKPSYSFHENLLGQCWSSVEESDAMWRIYSPSATGVRLASTAANFQEIHGMERAYLGRVTYFETIDELLELANTGVSWYQEALFKRAAFRHEGEVRLLTHGRFLRSRRLSVKHVSLPVDPAAFIEGVTIDPRADDWYVDAVKRYCRRAGVTSRVSRSPLYEPYPERSVNIVKRYVPMYEDESESDGGRDA